MKTENEAGRTRGVEALHLAIWPASPTALGVAADQGPPGVAANAVSTDK